MDVSVDFIHDSMSMTEQVQVWREEYMKLYRQSESDRTEWQKREEKGLKLIKQYQEENDKMEKTNKLGIKLVENLRKQIEKYQNNDNFKMNNHDNDDIDGWKSRFLTEKRTSEYLRAECEDLQNEIEELKQNNNTDNIDNNNNNNNNNNNDDNDDNKKLETVLKIVNEAWEEEVTALIEQFKNNNNNINNYNNLTHLKNEMKKEFNKKKEQILSNNNSNNNKNKNNNDNNINYKLLYDDLVKSKLKLIDETSQEIQKLRQIIHSQNTQIYRNIFDRIVRYHNLDGGNEDTLFQLMIDAELQNNNKKKI